MNFKIYFIISLWIVFIPIMFMMSIFGNIIENFFNYFNNDICLIFLFIFFVIITIVILFKLDKKEQ